MRDDGVLRGCLEVRSELIVFRFRHRLPVLSSTYFIEEDSLHECRDQSASRGLVRGLE